MGDPPSNEVLEFPTARTVAEVDRGSREWRMVIAGESPFDAGTRGARFIVAPPEEIPTIGGGAALDSTADLAIPSSDLDSDDFFDVQVHFFVGEWLVVVIAVESGIPRGVLLELVARLAGELPDGSSESVRDLGRDARWVVVRILRQRVRDTEESVRRALADEHISGEDYLALREYPARLARVEKLLGRMPRPEWESNRRPELMAIGQPDLFWKSLRDVGTEAREAVARLSGLIASQSVVVAQRQAEETERFQRLLTLVGTTVLVPGLVAAVFGANVDVPGNGTRNGFWAMLCFMVASGAGSYALLRSVGQDSWSRSGSDTAGTTHLWVLTAAASVCSLAGVWFLACA